MKSILCEQETSRKRFESSLQIANEENIKLQQKLIANKTHEEQLAAKIRALEEQIQRNASIAQRTLVETYSCMSKMHNVLGQIEEKNLMAQANASRMENLMMESLIKLVSPSLTVPAHQIKIEMFVLCNEKLISTSCKTLLPNSNLKLSDC